MTTNSRDVFALVWNHYFYEDKYSPQDPRVEIIDVFYRFFNDNEEALKFVFPFNAWDCCYIDILQFSASLPFTEFDVVLVSRPVEMSKCLGIALSTIYRMRNPYVENAVIVQPHFYNTSQITSYSNIKASIVGQMVCIEGNVTKIAPSRPMLLQGSFRCPKCQQNTSHYFEDGIFDLPRSCSTQKCYNKYLEFDRSTAKLCDSQRIRLTEIDSPSNAEEYRLPRNLDIELRGSLVHTCIPGDLVRIYGVVKTIQQELPRGMRYGDSSTGGYKGHRESGVHQLYVLASSVVVMRTGRDHLPTSTVVQVKDFLSSTDQASRTIPGYLLDHSIQSASAIAMPTHDFSEEELQVIRDIALSDNAFYWFVHSLSRQIYGQELVKAGLVLSLFGGDHSMNEGKKMRSFSVRSNIHMLMVGDPGMGKSQLLRAAAAVAPRGVLVTANTSTAAGLTVSIARDPQGGEVSIEAGALVLADRGACFVDEFDKGGWDPHAILEAMEQQSISIAKSGLITTLRARASVIAAANPSHGHYNKRKSIAENLKLNLALLSRFDLVFILVDKHDEKQDEMIAEHIFKMFPQEKGARNESGHSAGWGEYGTKNGESSKEKEDENMRTLSQKLRYKASSLPPPLSVEIMRRYISYAQQYVSPKLSRGAAKILQKHYLTLRRARAEAPQGALPVTLRHLEALIRLAQSRAKIDLREEVSEEDAKEVVMLMQESLLEAFSDEMGRIDTSKRGGQSMAKQMVALASLMQKLAAEKGSNVFHKTEIQQLHTRLNLTKDLDSVIESMRTECYLLLKGPKLYQLQTT